MKKILIVDDSNWMCEVIATHLKSEYYKVEKIADPRGAIDKLCTDNYDLLITDINMPQMYGLDLLTEVTNNPQTKDMAKVVLSIEDDERLKQQAKELGVKYWLHKPLDGKQLQQVVDFILKPK